MGDGPCLDDCEMLKALYDFEATLAKTLSFSEGEYFYLQQSNTKQRNWWHVVNRKGLVGFVPSNYVASVKVEQEFFLSFLNDCIKSLNENSSMSTQKQELLSKLTEKRKQIQMLLKPPAKKAQAPKPPPRLDDGTPPNGVSPSFDLRPVVSQQQITEERESSNSPPKSYNSNKEVEEKKKKPVVKTSSNQLSSDTDNQDDSQDSSESIKPNAIYEIVQAVRKETQLSHEMSKVAVETVLISLREFLPGGAARSIIDALLREANSNITCPKNAIDAAPDALRMMTALNALSKAANDAQQRGWALHDDAHDIQTQLLELISVMSNADVNISQHVLSSHKYAYVTTLVQYYQMETRWPLRQLLLQRARGICDEKHLNAELRHVEQVLRSNKLPVPRKHHRKRTKAATVERQPAILPYVKGVTDKIGRILKRASINTYFKPPKKINQFLPPVKCNIPFQVAGVYKLDCDCGLSYIGQTKRSIGTRVKEHVADIKHRPDNKSAVCEHTSKGTNHYIRFDKPQILAREPKYFPRLMREAIENSKYPNFNREDGWKIPQAWDPIIHQVKSQPKPHTARPKDTAFGVMCGLERTALATLALSALPAEIARDMRDNPRAVSRLSHSALLLSMVLSMGDKLPVTHFKQLGEDFAQFLLELIENPPETDENEQIPDLFLTLLLAYNLQFEQPSENLLLNALDLRDNAKTFCEKILLLLNREEDPVHIFDHEPAPPHSVLKLVIDLFSRKKTAGHFYTNDVKVAIDIIVRQLADLSPGDERRQQYLRILQGIIRNTDYETHLHRRQDLFRCFARIFCEETEVSREDQALVRSISNEFPQYFMA